MWVKTMDGRLLNLDAAWVVDYVAPQNITVAWDVTGGGYQPLGEGDLTQMIANALDAGSNLLEVEYSGRLSACEAAPWETP